MKKIFWILLDNRMGSVGQAKGIEQELDTNLFEVVEKNLVYSRWAGLPNIIRRDTLLGITNPEILQSGIPDFVLSTSRRTVSAALYLKKHHPHVHLLQLMFPGRYGADQFDKIFLPFHDANKKVMPNFYFTTGSPHRINAKTLRESADLWQSHFDKLPRPLTALIIGGAIKGKTFTQENAAALAHAVLALKHKIGGSLLVTDSRRTGADAEHLIMEILKDIPSHRFLWGSQDKNPLLGYYACADNIIVTGDSVSMCCEACGTGKPVFIFEGNRWLTAKHLRFTQSLFDGHYAVRLEQGCDTFVGGKILYPSAEIAEEIAKLVK
ncbi:MAG: mitochondrial fission ELM1 family protein [Alphaproteobacteria bacterium]|nr:mitochondrial fission ELM1 family protein [Alphaproteobacteria bacterium]